MLKQIKIQNFQSHADTTLNLSDGINAITGVSDSGKSAVTRAISWVTTNRPTGSAFTSYWAEKEGTKVALSFDTTTVTRAKSKTKNSYKLGNTKFDVVKTDVPVEIVEFLNLDTINIQGQHDRYFLMQDTSGEVARKLNKIANLEIIDFALAEVDSAIRDNGKKITVTEQLINSFTEDLKRYENLSKIEKLLDDLDAFYDRLKMIEQIVSSLTNLITQIKTTQQDISLIEDWLLVENEAASIFEFARQLKSSTTTLNSLTNTVEYSHQLEADIKRLAKRAACENQLENLIQQEKQLQKTKNNYNDLEHKIITIENLESDIADITEYLTCEPVIVKINKLYAIYSHKLIELSSLQNILQSVTKTLKQITHVDQMIIDKIESATQIIESNAICPLCGGSMTEDAVEHIKGWL